MSPKSYKNDKLRTATWLSHNQLQLPLGITEYGSIDRVVYIEIDVNSFFIIKHIARVGIL